MHFLKLSLHLHVSILQMLLGRVVLLIYIFYQFLHSLDIEPMTVALLALCSNEK